MAPPCRRAAAAIYVSADDDASGGTRVREGGTPLREDLYRPGQIRSLALRGLQAMKTFPDRPAEIQMGAGPVRARDMNLFVYAVADVADPEVARYAVKTVTPGIA